MEIVLLFAAAAVAYYFLKYRPQNPPTKTENAITTGGNQVVAAQPVVASKPQNTSTTSHQAIRSTPEDSTLSRHYAAQQHAERQAITHPYPTDSIQRRHYENRFNFSVKSQPEPIIDQQIVAEPAVSSCTARPVLPQDSVLQRHFIAQLVTKIESDSCSKPSDSTLKRHFEQLVQAQLNEQLLALESA